MIDKSLKNRRFVWLILGGILGIVAGYPFFSGVPYIAFVFVPIYAGCGIIFFVGLSEIISGSKKDLKPPLVGIAASIILYLFTSLVWIS